MKIHEFVGKKLLKESGIETPKGYVIKNSDSLQVKFLPAVLKSQVLVGSRMKAGGILFANTKDEFFTNASNLLEKEIRGEKPYAILVEEKINIKHEYYISLYIDRIEKDIKILFSENGGIEIENNKNNILNLSINDYKKLPDKFHDIVIKLHKLFTEKDLILLEINPFAEDENGKLIALDCVMHLDDNALFRQKWAREFVNDSYPFHFVKLDGDIGIIGCGAGIVMATMDAVNLYGGKPANFLDLGGGANSNVTLEALRLLKSLNVKKIIMNIFGGITKCDEIAKAIVKFKNENKNLPIFVRITGTNEEEAKQILDENNIAYFDDMYEMIKFAIRGEYQ
ncbi:succinyl-CoA synthetase beta subunit [Thermosipho japonicus]|uniref:Succinyl-CoA synthetase beta subunit n=1 Tax=Thermosipho japonicus TaxID=90323 RepID=A0A841GHM6_9BACT|nr:succinyl-CoA synthetase beta subunit [Thermosipho japonicus]